MNHIPCSFTIFVTLRFESIDFIKIIEYMNPWEISNLDTIDSNLSIATSSFDSHQAHKIRNEIDKSEN